MPDLAQEVLLVEDEKMVRDSLTRLLKARGYQVVPAGSGPQAILNARHAKVSVVLMDIALGGELDGIEVAEEIQKLQPLTSFIFVSAYVQDSQNHKRAQEKKIRVGGWVEKPFNVEKLTQIIERERKKLEALASVEAAKAAGLDPVVFFNSIKDSLPSEVIEETLAEVTAAYRKREAGESEGNG